MYQSPSMFCLQGTSPGTWQFFKWALGHFVRFDSCPMLKKTVVPTSCSNASWESHSLQQFWPDNWLPSLTSNRNRPQMAGLSLASRSFSQDLESEAMVSGSEAWNIRGTSEFWGVFAGSTKDSNVVTCRYRTLLYVTVVSWCGFVWK